MMRELTFLLFIFLAIAAFSYFYFHIPIGNLILNQLATTTIPQTTTVPVGNPTTTVAQTTMPTTTASSGNQSLYQYALSLINNDRAQYGLAPVTLSSEPSAQQHSDSMLQGHYFSHWDTFGMKPYMRYTLLGGTQSVAENIAYQSSSYCSLLFCGGNINPTNALQQMEYSMMYNDSACCNNGHRHNILDPNHNQVSIGIAYNSSHIYFTEDFVDSYIYWSQNSPAYSGSEAYLSGTLSRGYTLSSVLVSYDPPVSNMSRSQLAATSDYSYGQSIAGVVGSPLYYYSGLTTIVADQYSSSQGSFSISFNMRNLISQHGAGEYTILLWLNSTAPKNSFVGGSYTIFIDKNGAPFIPPVV